MNQNYLRTAYTVLEILVAAGLFIDTFLSWFLIERRNKKEKNPKAARYIKSKWKTMGINALFLVMLGALHATSNYNFWFAFIAIIVEVVVFTYVLVHNYNIYKKVNK